VFTEVFIEAVQQIARLLNEGWPREKRIGLVPADEIDDVGAVEACKNLLYWKALRDADLNLSFWSVRRPSYKRANLMYSISIT